MKKDTTDPSPFYLMDDQQIHAIIKKLRKELGKGAIPVVTRLAYEHQGPFILLVSTILSSRTKDEVTAAATDRLLALADNPQDILKHSEAEIIKAIYPVGFYRNKARTILTVCGDLIERFNARVPDTMEGLLSLKGVGRKTANLVLSLAFHKASICVDTHVHRISNRLGYVKTATPQETEYALQAKLPIVYWSIFYTLLVAFGRHICRPISPLCSKCSIFKDCDKVGVINNR
jgi:endonuclease-3